MVMVIPVVAGGLLGIAALAQMWSAAKQKPVGSTVQNGKKDEKKKTPGKPQMAAAGAAAIAGAKGIGLFAKILWGLGAVLVGLIIWLIMRPAKSNDDVDFYAGALDIPIDEAKKMTREYLAGKYAAKKREEKYGTPDKILGLQPTSIQATYGKKNFDFPQGGRQW